MLSSRILSVLGIVGLAAAAPQLPGPGPIACPQTMCIDGMHPDCGIRWGGCYDVCKPSLKPTMPPCPRPTKPTKPMSGRPSPRPTAPPSSSRNISTTRLPAITNCSSRTVCVDYVNECGQWYGGCHPDCRPWPS